MQGELTLLSSKDGSRTRIPMMLTVVGPQVSGADRFSTSITNGRSISGAPRARDGLTFGRSECQRERSTVCRVPSRRNTLGWSASRSHSVEKRSADSRWSHRSCRDSSPASVSRCGARSGDSGRATPRVPPAPEEGHECDQELRTARVYGRSYLSPARIVTNATSLLIHFL